MARLKTRSRLVSLHLLPTLPRQQHRMEAEAGAAAAPKRSSSVWACHYEAAEVEVPLARHQGRWRYLGATRKQ
jgi:hypothetical protein